MTVSLAFWMNILCLVAAINTTCLDGENCHNQPSFSPPSNEISIPCQSTEYTCQCGTTTPPTCNQACIPWEKYNDGFLDCPDKSDETHFHRTVLCGDCNVTIRRLPNILECNELGSLLCGNSTCYDATTFRCSHNDCDETEVICTSYCDTNATSQCKRALQCANGELILASQFCDGSSGDCSDNSDDRHYFRGFKCDDSPFSCSLPQINLFDDAAHCTDSSDLCLKDNKSCFECFDKSLSISSRQVCDGISDCYDGSDENDCDVRNNSSSNFKFYTDLFPPKTELIDNYFILSAFWIIGFIVIIGNLIVIVTNTKFLRSTKITDSLKHQYLIISNIAFADFIMGIYLLTIAVHSAIYSGYFDQVELEWRTSLRCSIIGSLAVISSQASCFLMVILTSFRLYTICKPIASRTSSLLPWKLCLPAAWLIAFTIAYVPVIFRSSQYFVFAYFYRNRFRPDGLFSKDKIVDFTIRYASLTGQTDQINSEDFASIRNFLESNFPQSPSVRVFGCYSATLVCLPGIFRSSFNLSIYTLAFITVNFLAFIFIAIGYILIYVRSTRKSKHLQRTKPSRHERRMQRRIARIILTDFCCWIPICIICFLYFGNHLYILDVKNLFQIIATILLPINSALNPFLFSPLADKLWEKIRCCKKKLTPPNRQVGSVDFVILQERGKLRLCDSSGRWEA